MAEGEQQNIFGKMANKVDAFFQARYYKIGSFVGRRPAVCIAVSLLFVAALGSGISRVKSESRPDKLWIPQGTRSQLDEEVYMADFPPEARMNYMILESKSSGAGGALTTGFLEAAMNLHLQIENITHNDDSLRTLCIRMPGDGHDCFIQSILGVWNYDIATLRADANPLATLNNRMSRGQLERLLGNPTFSSGGAVTDARAIVLRYFNQNIREMSGGDYSDPRNEGWEEAMLNLLKCDAPVCDGSKCFCGYDSTELKVYPAAMRSFADAFGSVIRGDVGLINMAFFLMIIYLTLNLGGLGHKLRSRALLSLGAIIAIVFGGAAGYGLSMWFGFVYSPIHSVLPFVVLGIGVDDSFVIMNAYDRTDPKASVPERIAQALQHAGVAIMVTSLTDFVALAISVSSALPALSSFCLYAALSIFFLFVLQISLFTAFATWDGWRVSKGRPDCCFCLPRGCPCCPTTPVDQAEAAVSSGQKDPNQMCCTPVKHEGGLVGKFLEHVVGPVLVKPVVAAAIIIVFIGFLGLCSWQASLLSVEDTQRNFIPDNSYMTGTLKKGDEYFSRFGTTIYLTTGTGDYYASQSALTAVSSRMGALSFVQPPATTARSWADAFKMGCSNNHCSGANTAGIFTNQADYYSTLSGWLNSTAGRMYANDVKWVNPSDPQQGIKASRMQFELAPMNIMIGTRLSLDSNVALQVMDDLRASADSWTDLPGGRALTYSAQFLRWETYRIIKKEMFLSVGLCLASVFVITLVLIAHPLTAFLVFLCVLMTIVDILGCLNMMGVAIDNVSVIQLVVAVGFCVDYAAHIGHNFMLQEGTLKERVTQTLGNVGAAVLNGGISTFLATMMLAMSKSYVFRILFYSFFLTVLLGMLHGMVLLPAVLSFIGPRSYGNSHKAAAGEAKAVEVDEKA